jgi:hypothetical protein
MFVEFRNVDRANENSVVSYELTSFNQPSGAVLTHARVDRYGPRFVPFRVERLIGSVASSRRPSRHSTKNLNRRERKDPRPEHGLGSAHNLRAASAATADPTRTIAIHARSTRVRPAPGSPARLAASSL